MSILRFLARPAMVAAMASALVTVAVCYVAFALTIRQLAPEWDPFMWQIKAAGVVLVVTAIVCVAAEINDRRKAIR